MIPKGMTPEQRDELKDMEAKSIYMPVNKTYTLRDSFQITNLTVTDKGGDITASYQIIEGCTCSDVTQQLSRDKLDPYFHGPYQKLHDAVQYYLNQNLK